MPALRRLPSGLWQATVRLPDGRRATKTDTSKQWVRGWGEAIEADIRRGLWVDPATTQTVKAEEQPTLTVGQWREQWMASRVREFNTAADDDLAWKIRVSYWANRRLDQITRLEIEQWSAQMTRKGVGPTSHHKALGHLRKLLRAAVDHDKIPTDPSHGVRKPTIPIHRDRILTRDESGQLDAVTGGDPMIRLMLWCGLRWGEAAGLAGEAVDMTNGHLWVMRVGLKNGVIKEYPKSRAGHRRVPMPSMASSAMTDIHRPGPLFRAPRGGGLIYRNWHRKWTKWLKAAGLDDPQPTPHDLRHTYGTWLADANVAPHDIASLMGHSDTRSTARYIHSGLVRDAAAIKALEG